METFSVLTVCTGNICRSPLAEQLLTLGLDGEPSVVVASSGTGALVGAAMPYQAQEIARGLGVRAPETHRARALTVAQLRDADLVVALSREHRRVIVEMFPRGARRTFTLRELARLVADIDDSERGAFAAVPTGDTAQRLRAFVEIAATRRGLVLPPESPDDDDVVDPYGRDDSTYRRSANEIVPAVRTLVEQLRIALAAQ